MLNNKRIYTLVSIFIFFIFVTTLFLYSQQTGLKKDLYLLENGWTFTVNDKIAEIQPGSALAAFVFPSAKIGDVLSLSRTFAPGEENPYSTSIAFDTWHLKTDVYVDDVLIYSWGQELLDKNQMLGAMRHTVSLPENYSGKELKLVMTASEDNPMPNLTSVICFKSDNPHAVLFNRPIILLALGSIFFFTGLAIIFISLAFRYSYTEYLNIFALGITIFLMGIYVLARGKFLSLLIESSLLYNALEYISLYSLPFFLMTYQYTFIKNTTNKLYLIVYRSVLISSGAFIPLSLILNTANLIHLCRLLTFYNILSYMACIILIVGILSSGKSSEENRFYRKMSLYGLFTFLLGAILYITSFLMSYNPYFMELLSIWKWYDYIFPLSITFMVIFFFIGFISNLNQIVNKSYKSEFLRYIAYSDALTSLLNRRSFEDELSCIVPADEVSFISIDLNGLKQTNDTLGHDAGDHLLTNFSSILSSEESKSIQAFRMGGDEFSLISYGSPKDAENLINRINNKVSSFNLKQKDFTLSFSYGISENREADSPHNAYVLADERMYENKRKGHSPKA